MKNAIRPIIFCCAWGLFFVGCKQQENNFRTSENLRKSIVLSATASAKYAAYAIKAEEEGYPAVAKLFEAISRSKNIHAKSFSQLLRNDYGQMVRYYTLAFKVGNTSANLEESVYSEKNTIENLLPKFLSDARRECMDMELNTDSIILQGEIKQLVLLGQAFETLKKNADNSLPQNYAVCPVCGNIFDLNTDDKKCPHCKTSHNEFIEI